MRGRKPKPTAQKLLDGNPGHRPISLNEWKPSGIPTCPAGMSKEAKKEWRRISKELLAAGLLTTVDRAILANYVSAWAIWYQATTELEQLRQTAAAEGKSNLIFRTKTGYLAQHPLIGTINSAASEMRKCAAELGLTPSARSRLQVDPPTKGEDPFETFMRGLGAADDMTASNDICGTSN